jgi:hypothetical protein
VGRKGGKEGRQRGRRRPLEEGGRYGEMDLSVIIDYAVIMSACKYQNS